MATQRMGAQKYCDVCGHYRTNLDGSPAVHRYGLSRQLPVRGEMRPDRDNSKAFKRSSRYGGIDMCDECWDKIAKPKTRPELRGKTHLKASA